MKVNVLSLPLALFLILTSCKSNTRYLDLNTNEHIAPRKDTTTGYIMNSKTGEPVDFYVNTKTHDTVYGPTGEIVNGRIHKNEDGKWIVRNNPDEYLATSESESSAKVKTERADYKLKKGNYTVKKKSNGVIKIENGRTQVKVDGKTGKRKVKRDNNITKKLKSIVH
jgi:hypothetical protein